MTGYLSLTDGTNVPVKDGLLLGRVAGCDIVVDDSKASRRHARVIAQAGVVEIEDLGSSNGTLLNGKPVERRMLRDGDEVQIGATVIVYREGPLPGSAAAAAARGGAVFADDDELFTDTAPAAPAPPKPTSASRPAASAPPPAVEPPAAPPPAASPPPAVVEFADEVVEVRARAPSPAKPSAPAAPANVAASKGRVLQFSKQAAGKGGVLGDDLGQMSGGLRTLLVLGVLAFGIAAAVLVVKLVR